VLLVQLDLQAQYLDQLVRQVHREKLDLLVHKEKLDLKVLKVFKVR
jgi:hypothetical protein